VRRALDREVAVDRFLLQKADAIGRHALFTAGILGCSRTDAVQVVRRYIEDYRRLHP